MTWQPGDPIYTRPRTSAEGNVIRPLIQLVDFSEAFGSDGPDAARWPRPKPHHDLTATRYLIPALDMRCTTDTAEVPA